MLTRFDFTTVVKAFAICLVVLTHADWTGADRLCPIFPFVVSAAVPLFMMVTGLNYARSYQRRGMDTLSAMYNPSAIRRRVSSLLLPFIPIFLLEIPLAALRNHLGYSAIDLSPWGLIAGFVSGGWGPGGYYLPVMLQVIVIYPVLFCAVRHFRRGAFIGVALGCFALDCAQTALGFSAEAWRLLCVRYLPYLAFGALLAEKPEGSHAKDSGIGIYAAMLVIGGGYLACLTYGPLAETLSALQSGWSGTSLPSALFFMGAFGLLYARFRGFRPPSSRWTLIAIVAQDTWFIFLVQSIWYFAGANSVFGFLPVPVTAVLFLVICVLMGCVFGKLWKRLSAQMIVKG